MLCACVRASDGGVRVYLAVLCAWLCVSSGKVCCGALIFRTLSMVTLPFPCTLNSSSSFSPFLMFSLLGGCLVVVDRVVLNMRVRRHGLSRTRNLLAENCLMSDKSACFMLCFHVCLFSCLCSPGSGHSTDFPQPLPG